MTKRRKGRGKGLPGRPASAKAPAARGVEGAPSSAKREPGSSRASSSFSSRRQASIRRRLWALGIAGVALLGLFAIFATSNRGGGDAAGGKYSFQVGRPGPGAAAPAVRLPSTAGGTFDLASLRGQRVLLYFQEGVGCQPCWDQIVDIEKNTAAFRKLGINHVVSITVDSLDALRQKVGDEGIHTPVLSDPDLRVSRAYDANSYGMMGNSTDGHTFLLVDAHGTILWRADYGGSPDYTMYVPPRSLLADLRRGIAHTAR